MKKKNPYIKIVIRLLPDSGEIKINMYLKKNNEDDMKLYHHLLSGAEKGGRKIGQETTYRLYRNQGLIVRGSANDAILINRIKAKSVELYGERDRKKLGDIARRMLLEELGIDRHAARSVKGRKR